ncbi:MAG TPA: FAD-binding oxidoreductase [Chloroflexota bacterium]|nr:FAD-binding oxidoreductase [Chloroflexota bacterium]
MRPGRRTLVAGVAALAVVGAAARTAWTLAAGPAGEKDCGAILPQSGGAPVAAAPPADGGGLTWAQRGGALNDASCLDRTPVHGVVRVTSEEDVRRALAYARANRLGVSMAGARHSMGGHAFNRHGVVLDMNGLNRVAVNAAAKTMVVQAGATWHDIQNALHPRFAVKAMQSTDIFTVGGSISVNAHGMDHHAGALAGSIRWVRVMLPDGTVVRTSRTENEALFRHVVGGYGLFGVILEAELDVVDNVLYHSERRTIAAKDFERVWREELNGDGSVALFYGHLSTAPDTLLDEMILYLYRDTGVPAASVPDLPALGEVSMVGLRRFVFNLSKWRGPAMWTKWWAEKNVEPKIEGCTVTTLPAGVAVPRAAAQASDPASKVCLVSRNEPMHDSVPYLRNRLPGETDILHEYFIPRERFAGFVDAARRIFKEQRANVLNASVRVVAGEDVALTYAPRDAFSLVLYVNQRTDAGGNAAMERLTRSLIDAAADVGGRFFLPYQLHYTAQQLERAYPNVREFFAAKRRYDPDGLLTNTWYATFAPALGTT